MALAYADDAMENALEIAIPDHRKLEWIRARDQATRGEMAQLINEGWPGWGSHHLSPEEQGPLLVDGRQGGGSPGGAARAGDASASHQATTHGWRRQGQRQGWQFSATPSFRHVPLAGGQEEAPPLRQIQRTQWVHSK